MTELEREESMDLPDDLDIPEVDFEYQNIEDEGCEGGACKI